VSELEPEIKDDEMNKNNFFLTSLQNVWQETVQYFTSCRPVREEVLHKNLTSLQ